MVKEEKGRYAISGGMNRMISQNIQAARKALGLTQEDLANRLSVARQTVAKWESGESLPDLENA